MLSAVAIGKSDQHWGLLSGTWGMCVRACVLVRGGRTSSVIHRVMCLSPVGHGVLCWNGRFHTVAKLPLHHTAPPPPLAVCPPPPPRLEGGYSVSFHPHY